VKIPAKIYFYSLHFLTPEVKKVPACRRSGKTHDRVLRDPLWPASLRRAARRGRCRASDRSNPFLVL